MKTRVLVTCVGSGVGQSVVDSLNLSRNFYIVGCDGNPNVYAHSFCDKFYVVKGIYEDNYIENIIENALTEKIQIIIPGHDYELFLFSTNIDKFKSVGLEVLVSGADVIKASRNKKDWYNYFKPMGCSIVPTFELKEFLKNPDSSILPAIIKPAGGSASQGIFIINNIDEIPEDIGNDLIIQPYLFPEKSDNNYQKIKNMVDKGKFLQMSEISIQLIFDKNAKFKDIFISKNVLKNGVPVHIDPIKPKEFKHLDEILKFVPVLEEKGVMGPVNIQGRVTDKGIYFFEMNMRFTGITGNRALFGFNEVVYLVNNFLGKDAKLNGYSLNKVGVRQVACATIPKTTGINTITILGGGSNIGKYFIKKNIASTQKINLIVRESSIKKYEKMFAGYDNVQIISPVDEYLDNYLTESDALINFVSALANTTEEKMYEAIRFIQILIPRIAKAKISRIVNISSQSVYNQKLDEEKTEENEVFVDRAYAFQKVMMEELFASINQYNPLSKVVSLRLTRVLNPKDKEQCGFFGKIISELKKGNTVKIQTPLNKTNLIHIHDVSRAIGFVLYQMSNFEEPEIINVGGANISMQDFCKKVENIFLIKDQVIYDEQKSDKIVSIVDDSKFKLLGWKCEKSIDDIIKEI
ncbi:hypothetical protein CSC81_01135 [Tenacibaculum discolor]|uniref:NAD-dependent epimerase/dehydratase family protein n=1 Tax=Tenacibaculum discolor TaxID=361581 RepID=A0A2G1BXQ9_9FLAO|nr:NAD-dependent epimerase/dehydratase family protein [Tenacibaculum discolor]MDP2541107.1 NAD-dependent epimerase/dehydratase family protein [Tenacibaculum discolor]PHN98820.1 hypothetical protein CSC81_01135 [Tenacibaculum discolor]